eukprot:Sspe_Gene.112446::Locus_95460_Transcript_1_1_Confidence_1.000_Length_446::g.112446::m.112446
MSRRGDRRGSDQEALSNKRPKLDKDSSGMMKSLTPSPDSSARKHDEHISSAPQPLVPPKIWEGGGKPSSKMPVPRVPMSRMCGKGNGPDRLHSPRDRGYDGQIPLHSPTDHMRTAQLRPPTSMD